MKFIKYKNLSFKAGISHHTSNLKCMIKEAYLSERTLIVPPFQLAAKHNLGRSIVTTMAEYYDYDNVEVEGSHFRMEYQGDEWEPSRIVKLAESCLGIESTIIEKDIAHASLLRPKLQRIYSRFDKVRLFLPVATELSDLAARVYEAMPNDTIWIHVRRGDKTWKTRGATSPENIRKVVGKIAPGASAIYIATDEKNLEHFMPLTSYYEVICFRDFEEFEKLQLSDNYRLFLAEQELAKLCVKRISTFRSGRAFFHGSLSGSWGWQ